MNEEWSEDYHYCRACHKTTHPHMMEGYCQKCFNKLEANIEVAHVERDCLKCGDKFLSEGLGNRRCNKCNKKDSQARHRHRLNINS